MMMINSGNDDHDKDIINDSNNNNIYNSNINNIDNDIKNDNCQQKQK